MNLWIRWFVVFLNVDMCLDDDVPMKNGWRTFSILVENKFNHCVNQFGVCQVSESELRYLIGKGFVFGTLLPSRSRNRNFFWNRKLFLKENSEFTVFGIAMKIVRNRNLNSSSVQNSISESEPISILGIWFRNCGVGWCESDLKPFSELLSGRNRYSKFLESVSEISRKSNSELDGILNCNS